MGDAANTVLIIISLILIIWIFAELWKMRRKGRKVTPKKLRGSHIDLHTAAQTP